MLISCEADVVDLKQNLPLICGPATIPGTSDVTVTALTDAARRGFSYTTNLHCLENNSW